MISLFGSNVGKEELGAVGDCFDRQWLGIGPKTAEFEKQISEKIGGAHFSFLNSGSNSLHLAIKLLNIPEGSEVILPSFTWIACANAVMLNNLKPVFCDVDRSTCNVTAEAVAAKITKKTKAIMVVHYAGKPVDMDSLKQFNLPIIEDAAHAIDSYYKGQHCGAIGDVGIFSFDAVKNLTTGEGGGVVTRNPEYAKRSKNLRYCGISKSGFEASATKDRWWEYDVLDYFPKMLNSDMNAAMGLEQLKKLSQFQERRKQLWDLYTDTLTKESWANSWLEAAPGPEAHEKHSYFTYFIKLRSGSRDKLAKFLYDRGIYSSLRYHPLHLNKKYDCPAPLENCDWLNEVALNIPLHHRMTDQEVGQVLDGLKAFRQQMM